MGSPILRYESGQTAYPFEDMTDSGDRTTFSASFSPISQATGAEAIIAPYGLLTGGAVTPNATDDQVDVAALTASMAGATGAGSDGVLSVSAETGVTVLRGATTNTHRISSITITSAGAIAAVPGTASTAFSETRGADGGPPLIPVGSVEVAQVRLTSITSAAIASGEIFSVPGLHQELASYPTYQVDYGRGQVTFNEALPAIHTGSVTKKVSIKGSTPLFAPLPNVSDWVPAESTYSVTSTDTYDGPVGASSATLNQASFSVVLQDGITDAFLSKKGQNIWTEFRPDRDKLFPKQLTQGILGVSRTNPAGGGRPTASCTVSPTSESLDLVS